MNNLLKHWKLVNRVPVECGFLEWVEYFESPDRLLNNTYIPFTRISTVFLGLDHSFYFGPEETEPILFESMIFGGSFDSTQWRYATYQESQEGHKQLCEIAEKAVQAHSSKIMVWILSALLIGLLFD